MCKLSLDTWSWHSSDGFHRQLLVGRVAPAALCPSPPWVFKHYFQQIHSATLCDLSKPFKYTGHSCRSTKRGITNARCWSQMSAKIRESWYLLYCMYILGPVNNSVLKQGRFPRIILGRSPMEEKFPVIRADEAKFLSNYQETSSPIFSEICQMFWTV